MWVWKNITCVLPRVRFSSSDLTNKLEPTYRRVEKRTLTHSPHLFVLFILFRIHVYAGAQFKGIRIDLRTGVTGLTVRLVGLYNIQCCTIQTRNWRHVAMKVYVLGPLDTYTWPQSHFFRSISFVLYRQMSIKRSACAFHHIKK